MELDDIDRTGLIREAYNIEGISEAECRSIFVDWALKLPPEFAAPDAVARLHQHYAEAAPDHPMSAVLREGLAAPARPKRRGGRKARVS